MKQIGEVYQSKSMMGNARKREICVVGEMLWLSWSDPPQTPPHKWEGLERRTPRVPLHDFICRKVAAWHYTVRQVSPSPLWGGVGEGSFLRLA
ncbi:hypothetical protein ACVITL_005459 [Rhizobium pisi]